MAKAYIKILQTLRYNPDITQLDVQLLEQIDSNIRGLGDAVSIIPDKSIPQDQVELCLRFELKEVPNGE
jgi:hypothetical protein